MFVYETQAYPGVNRVASMVRDDLYLVTGFHAGEYSKDDKCRNLVIFGTVDRSDYLARLEERGIIDLSPIRGKWEVYSFQVIDAPLEGVDHALVIAGSDKRGTIYGLFHLSELLGVSPLVNWNHVRPRKKKNASLTDDVNLISREPSVRYRGFFINDEWPAFGNWAEKHFGGINAKCYERIFELLLRLKGNYLWPAMWHSNFSMDGPGLESARLADEYGVVMSTSHHEPCMRSGEEYSLLRGRNSIYGDAWSFIDNREGILRFWRDGLLRNKPFENVITLGMRGERDSAILGRDASVKDNIDLLRDVLRTQNSLIRETLSGDLSQIPRQIVLFSEVEEFFYGDEETEGLMNDPELEGVTLMLSDNNCGYTRTLPTEEMRDHPGGFGMYYHMDMHGGPLSFQWIGATYLPRVWEQMTQAYDYGVRQIWVVNIGDIGTQELGLSYFLDLAYDIDRWGGEDASVTETYMREWTKKQFPSLTASAQDKVCSLIWDYTGLLEKRKHEIMNAHVYHPLHFDEAENVLSVSEAIFRESEKLKKKIPDEDLSAFVSLLYYPACGTANLMKMWILTGRNHLYAAQNRIEANSLSGQIEACIQADRALIDEYEAVDGGYYEGFGRSEHVGFVNWNDEDNRFPVTHIVHPANYPRMLVARKDDEHYMTGLYWCDHPQTWREFLRPDTDTIEFDIMNASDQPFQWRIETDCAWMHFSRTSGTCRIRERITLSIERAALRGPVKGVFTVEQTGITQWIDVGKATVTVETAPDESLPGCFMEHEGIICMEAAHFADKKDVKRGAFKVLRPYGRSGSAIKVFPSTADFVNAKERPRVSYHFSAEERGEYRLIFDLAPTTPTGFDPVQYLCFSVNRDRPVSLNTVLDPDRPFYGSAQWIREARDNVKKAETLVTLKKGKNTLHFYGMSPSIVLERIVLVRKDAGLPASYLGPKESYIRAEI